MNSRPMSGSGNRGRGRARPRSSQRTRTFSRARWGLLVLGALVLAALVVFSFAPLASASSTGATHSYSGYKPQTDTPESFISARTAPDRAQDKSRLVSAAERALTSATGSITGKVTSTTGTKLEGVEIYAYTEDAEPVGYGVTDSTGAYMMTEVPNVKVLVATSNMMGYVDEWYDNVVLIDFGYQDGAKLLDLAANPTQTGIDFALAKGRTISGKVTNSSSSGLVDVEVTAFTLDGEPVRTAHTGSTGTYTITGLPAGQYLVATTNYNNYIDEWYKDVVYATHPDGTGATSVNVTSGNATAINFSLALGKSISGNVSVSGSPPVDGGMVDVFDLSGALLQMGGWISESGTYHITGLPAGQYLLRTDGTGAVDKWYNGDPVILDPAGDSATPITVGTSNLTNKDFALVPGAHIAGTVKTSGGTPLVYAEVTVQPMSSGDLSYMTGTETDESGAYEIGGLPDAQYLVNTGNDQGYVDEWWDNIPAPGNLDGVGVDTVDLSGSSRDDINFALDKGYTISGNVTDSTTGQGLQDSPAIVEVYNAADALFAAGWAYGDEGYTTWAVPAGTYYAEATDEFLGGYVDEWYNNKPAGQYGLGDADAINLTSADATGIDFVLDHLTRYEQTDPRIAFSGTWTPASASDASGGSYDYSTAGGSSATIYFSGTRLDWVAGVGTTCGLADVYVDDKLVDTVDLSNPQSYYDAAVWSTGALSDGDHHVRIAYSATNTAGKRITLDAVQVAGTLEYAPPAITTISPSAGNIAGGTVVTITGIGLAEISSVIFDGTPATGISSNTAGTQVTCSTPAHDAGAVTVTVTTPRGTADTSYTYQTAPDVTRYDQIDTHIVKTGIWANYASPGSYNASYGRSSTSGASATIWFNGTQLDWIAFEGTTTGKADVYVDGVKVTGTTPINLAASPVKYQQKVWSTGALPNGLHSVKIVRSSASASGKFLTLDAVDIYGSLAAAPTKYQQTDLHIVKTGSWSNFTSASASGGSYGRSLASGASATITFNGSRLDWIAMKGTTTGYADVWVDGVKVTSTPINLTAPSASYQVAVWSSGTLIDGVHTVQIVRNDALSGTTKYVTLDAVNIWGTIQTPSS